MRKIGVRSVTVILCVCILMLLLFPKASFAGDCDEWVAKVVSVQGVVQAKRTGETLWAPVKLNDTFCAGDMLRVQGKSRAAVVLSNETVARLDQETSVTFTGVEEKKVSLLDLLKGTLPSPYVDSPRSFFKKRRICLCTVDVSALVAHQLSQNPTLKAVDAAPGSLR